MTDKFVSPCPPPEGREREILTILVEECAEVQQRATKALRFGIEEVQPGQPCTNAQRLAAEVGDLMEMVAILVEMDILDPAEIDIGRDAKRRQLARFLQTA